MINSVTLTGRLTRDSELRYTPNGKAVANFTLAVNRKYVGEDGERQADFINCVIWGQRAEALANYTSKGSLIGVEGEIATRSYEHEEKGMVYVTEVNVTNFAFLESNSKEEEQPKKQSKKPYNKKR